MALQYGGEHPVAITIPAGTVVEIIGIGADERFVNAHCNAGRVAMFVVDLRARADQVCPHASRRHVAESETRWRVCTNGDAPSRALRD